MTKSNDSVDVILRELELNPKCIHGPTILFSLKNGKKFFSCAGIRSKNCFYLDFDEFKQERVKEYSQCSETKAKLNNLCYDEVQSTNSSERIFCKTCGIFIKSISFHESHNFTRGVSDEFIREPSLFLPQLDNDKSNAQYF